MKKIAVLVLLLLCSWWAHGQILTDSNLPIVVIETDNGVTIPDEPRVYGNMKIIWHQDGSRNYLTDVNNPEFLNYNGRISIEIRGSSSQMLPKKPYGLTTLQADDETNNNVSLLGMPKENDWVLNSLAFDQTGMRDVLSYELSERLGQYASRRVYCEVVINNDYKGLYAFMEKIKVDDNRVNVEKMDATCNSYPEITGGYITKADKTTGNDPVAWTMQGYGSGWWGGTSTDFIHHYPKPSEITNSQNNYIHGVFNELASKAGSHDTSITSGIPSVIDIPSFVDFMIIAELSSNVDVYQLSTFFHKDRKGKLRAGPVWDYNLTFGHDEFGYRSRYDVWQFDNQDNNGPRFWKDLFDTDEFKCYLAKRWFEVTAEGNFMSYSALCDRMDEIEAWITEAVGRDNQRWSKMTQHVSEVQSMKTWIQQRINWLNNNIGSYSDCAEVDLPPLVISQIHYHPMDVDSVNGNQLEFIQITNNGDEEVDLTGVYLRELGITYSFPQGSSIAARDQLVLCSDSVTFVEYYHRVPFAQYERKLSNKSENIVIADAWGNVIDEVCYQDDYPWPWEADGQGAYLQLIDLDLDNSLPESWVAQYSFEAVAEHSASEEFSMYPNPADGMITIVGGCGEYRITNVMGQILRTGLINSDLQQIDISRLPAGMYFVTIGKTTKKLVVK
ncbi:MAG: CotH kinase family protein [Bacteroidales bacterium]|nr:CotH kinase family protein [Bacteroidales bacterium]